MKVKPSELRLGNLFEEKHSFEIIRVIELTEDKIYFSGIFEEAWQAEPIQLDDQWLLKLGFEIIGDIYILDRIRIESGMGFQFGEGYSFRIKIDRSNSALICFVKYVHQVQNLYFLITGRELYTIEA